MLLSLLSKRILDADSRNQVHWSFQFENHIHIVLNRDAYGFTVRPQHLQRYREYTDIYKVLDSRHSFYASNHFFIRCII
ncbi:hypothetical protein RHSIM_RhsimUnG0119900 [Rhododendron simsii]|uniref:Uncharacterized protein n=1 Tax=Rhododendron simsii TaxID=118357 RepID=A0A834L4V3_RHOSS|nr:hypothetical protein RHSIM_RhsimUnG0119900 [Rhododendron simsii]